MLIIFKEVVRFPKNLSLMSSSQVSYTLIHKPAHGLIFVQLTRNKYFSHFFFISEKELKAA